MPTKKSAAKAKGSRMKKSAKKSAPKRSVAKAAPQKKSPAKKAAATRPAPSAKPLWQKLFVKGGTVLLMNAPAGYDGMFAGSPASVITSADGLANPADTVLVFANDTAEVDALLPTAIGALGPSASLWIAYRKGGKALHRDTLARQVDSYGFGGVALVAVDDVWSALRVKRT